MGRSLVWYSEERYSNSLRIGIENQHLGVIFDDLRLTGLLNIIDISWSHSGIQWFCGACRWTNRKSTLKMLPALSVYYLGLYIKPRKLAKVLTLECLTLAAPLLNHL